MITNPDCFPDEDESVSGCEEGSLESNIATGGIGIFVLSLIILGLTKKEDEENPSDEKWWYMLTYSLIGWVCYGLISSFINSPIGGMLGAMFAISPFLVSCMAVCLIALVVISYLSRTDSSVDFTADSNYPQEKDKSDLDTSCVICGASIISNHSISKAAKVAVYTPVTSWIGATIGMAIGGFAGLFAGGLIGGAKGAAKGMQHDVVCSDCKVNK